MNKDLRRAIRAAQLSAGVWVDRFDGPAIYSPVVPAGIKTLQRANRADLSPALQRRCNTGRYDVHSLYDAKGE